MTNLSTFYNKYLIVIFRISLGYPMFAVIFFLANASFLGLSSLMVFIFMCKKKQS
jgi:LMBR1 domain-containing protein 1